MVKPRILLIAEACNPEWASVPLVGWSHSRALAEVADVHLVTQTRNRDAILKAGLVEGREFTAIDSEAIARPAYRLAEVLRGGKNKGWTTVTAIQSLTYGYFERLVWRHFKTQIRDHGFDIVHRLTPLSPTTPSPIAAKCYRAGVPFILGPLNGGVPWPKEFEAARRKEREWLSYFRGMHRLIPSWRATFHYASAAIIGSQDTWEQIEPKCHGRCFYIPENGIAPQRFVPTVRGNPALPLHAVFAGRLVPYKGADMAIEAAADGIRSGYLTLTIVGDGPERNRLEKLGHDLRLTDGLRFTGWVPQPQVHEYLSNADLFLFPSIREFGGAVALEAMAAGAVPIVVDYGGPAELVTASTGYLVPMGSRGSIVETLRQVLASIVEVPAQLLVRREAAAFRVQTMFTWNAKARQVLEVYRWVLGQRVESPVFRMPFSDSAAAEGASCAV